MGCGGWQPHARPAKNWLLFFFGCQHCCSAAARKLDNDGNTLQLSFEQWCGKGLNDFDAKDGGEWGLERTELHGKHSCHRNNWQARFAS